MIALVISELLSMKNQKEVIHEKSQEIQSIL